MSVPRIAKRAGVATTLVALWFVAGWIWYGRAVRIFGSDTNASWHKATVPEGVDLTVEIPSTEDMSLERVSTDWYSRALLRAAADPRYSCVTVSCDISALDRFCKDNRECLYRYLASHPGWSFRRRNGRLAASRRVQKGEQWHLQDWRVDYDNTRYDPVLDDFIGEEDMIESSCTILFDGIRFLGPRCKSGEDMRLELKPARDDSSFPDAYFDYRLICDGECLSLQVDESRTFPTSRVVRAVFELTGEEFARLAGATNWPMVKATLPEGAVRRGPPTIDLARQKDGCGHTYQAWVNPGEPGETYLRVVEVSHEYEFDTRDTTMERVGWSEDPEEKFFIGGRIGLRGNEGNPYAVRIEVRFVPASGCSERKLIERVFKVEGGGQ